MKKERIWKSSDEKALILEALGEWRLEHLETYNFIKKETLWTMFYYELNEVLIDIDICVEHPWKSAYIRKIKQPLHV